MTKPKTSIVECYYCHNMFEKRLADIKRSKRHFCNKDCHRKWMKECSQRQSRPCSQCGIEFQPKDAKQKFCSHVCAARCNNATRAARGMQPEGRCFVCGTPIRSYLKYCSECRPKHNMGSLLINNTSVTIAEILCDSDYKCALNNRVRELARILIKSHNIPHICSCCGYTLHVEIHHIKPIASFDVDEKLIAVNNLSNLMLVCRNCHWEVHHGLREPIPIQSDFKSTK
jgi:hypothetical protein